MQLGLCHCLFLLVVVLLESSSLAWSWTFSGQGFSRRQLCKVVGYSGIGIIAAPVLAEDALVAPVEVAATGDAKKVSGPDSKQYVPRIQPKNYVC